MIYIERFWSNKFFNLIHLLPYLRYFFENTLVRCPVINTAYNTVILPTFMVWRFCGKSLFPHSFKLCMKMNNYEINFFPEGKDDCLQREYLFQLATTQNPNMWK